MAASDEVFRLATSRPIETEQSDLLGLAEHCAALAEIVTWILRTAGPWRKPPNLPYWTPSCWTGPSGLRRIAFTDRWDDRRALGEGRDWRTLEGALYGLPMTIIGVVLGPMRDGRRHGPLTKGWLHPRSQELRFRKRDGGGFDGNWQPVWRERYQGNREEWLEAMTQDGVLEETIIVNPPIEFDAEETKKIRQLAESKIRQIHGKMNSERNLSRCFDPIHPCEFRFPCAYFKEPEEGKGFVKISL